MAANQGVMGPGLPVSAQGETLFNLLHGKRGQERLNLFFKDDSVV